MNTNPVHNYRGHTITKHDTGARRMGRVISYTIHDAEGRIIGKNPTLTTAKARIDWMLDATPADIAHRDAVLAMLTAPTDND